MTQYIEITTDDMNLGRRILENVPGMYDLEEYHDDTDDGPVMKGAGTPSPLTDPAGTPAMTVVEENTPANRAEWDLRRARHGTKERASCGHSAYAARCSHCAVMTCPNYINKHR